MVASPYVPDLPQPRNDSAHVGVNGCLPTLWIKSHLHPTGDIFRWDSI